MGYWNSFAPYVSVANRKASAQRHVEKLRKKGGTVEPVVVQGRKIATSWWGKSWNRNLERYADYSNRIGRGRSYVCNGMALDLKIEGETIKALVAGSQAKPYNVTVNIKKLSSQTWKDLVEKASGKIESMQELLSGSFPQELQELFFSMDSGLFPKPTEITFDCSCPDWASMCKHVAATLYGIGARLDNSPGLFFTLRGVSVDDLVGTIAKKESETLLKKKKTVSKRIIDDLKPESKEIEALFGISMGSDTTAKLGTPTPKPKRISGKPEKPPMKKTVVKQTVKLLKKKSPIKKTVPEKKILKKKAVKR
jgi:uncharacterized Zn finger protein